MALIICRECRNSISSSAKACPLCGERPKKSSFLLTCAILIFGLWGIGKLTTQTPSYTVKIEKTEAEKADDIRAAAVRMAVPAVQSSLRNPASLVWEEAFSNKTGNTICLQFRAQNGFGGMNREYAVFYLGKRVRGDKAWNKMCQKGMIDMTYSITGANSL